MSEENMPLPPQRGRRRRVKRQPSLLRHVLKKTLINDESENSPPHPTGTGSLGRRTTRRVEDTIEIYKLQEQVFELQLEVVKIDGLRKRAEAAEREVHELREELAEVRMEQIKELVSIRQKAIQREEEAWQREEKAWQREEEAWQREEEAWQREQNSRLRELKFSVLQSEFAHEMEARAKKLDQDANRRVDEAKKEVENKVAEALRNVDEAREISKQLLNQVTLLARQVNTPSGPKTRRVRTISNERGIIDEDCDHSDDPNSSPEEALVDEHALNRRVCGNEGDSKKTTFLVADLETLCVDCCKFLNH